jgi:leucyl aminopeptidase
MTLPSLQLIPDATNLNDDDVLVVGLGTTDAGISVRAEGLAPDVVESILSSAQKIQADGSSDKTWRIPSPAGCNAGSVVLTGLGSGELDAHTLANAAGYAAMALSKPTPARIVFALPHSGESDVAAISEGALLGSHRVSKIGTTTQFVTTIAVVGSLGEAALSRVTAAARAVWQVRDLVTMPPNFLNPQTFVDQVGDLAKHQSVTVEILDEKQLAEQGYGGISAVGKGSQNPPRLMVLRYQPAKPTRHIALVGKGITFDSGGLSLKAPNAMVGMKYDMTGAAVMASATLAAASLGSPAAITAYLCLAENMPSGSASRPNDVITILGGKTVEILNTDAEGRLVMADGLQAASALAPDLIIDIATLTGAARVALGERYAGLMGTNDAVEQIVASAKATGELVWPMPLPEELRSLLKSDVADIANAKPGEALGGMLLAGIFLRDFVGENIPWAHLDIAGPAANSQSPWGFTPKGATGALTRTILDVLMAQR